jgi:hypothetical protein
MRHEPDGSHDRGAVLVLLSQPRTTGLERIGRSRADHRLRFGNFAAEKATVTIGRLDDRLASFVVW